MTIIALPPTITPTIVCPDWCTVSQAEHIADLDNWEGFVIHWGPEVQPAPECEVRHASTTYSDGTPDPAGPPHVFVTTPPESFGLDDAEAFARAILAAVSEARA